MNVYRIRTTPVHFGDRADNGPWYFNQSDAARPLTAMRERGIVAAIETAEAIMHGGEWYAPMGHVKEAQ